MLATTSASSRMVSRLDGRGGQPYPVPPASPTRQTPVRPLTGVRGAASVRPHPRVRRNGNGTAHHPARTATASATTTVASHSPNRGSAAAGRQRTEPRSPLRRGRHRSRRAPRRLGRGRKRAADRRHGPVGLRQVDAHAHPRRPRPAHLRRRLHRRHRDRRAERHAADEAAPQAHRLHLPVLQPAADADREGEHRAPAVDRRHEAGRRLGRRAGRRRSV